jgi:DNA-binding LacI/PurR family transcriptional regulator
MVKKPSRGRPPGHGNRYDSIAADLARRLAAGEWPVGKALPSYRQLAHSYGAGLQAVRLALKQLAADGSVVISPRRRPTAALGETLSTVLTGSIAAVCTFPFVRAFDPGDVQSMWRGITHAAARVCTPVIVLQDNNRWRTHYPAGINKMPLAGALLMGPFRHSILRQYEDMKFPVVLLDQPGGDLRFHSVSVNNFQAAFDAVSRLVRLGHRRIAFIRSLVSSLNDIDPDSKERQAGFVAGCVAAGLREGDYKIFSSYHSGDAVPKEIVRAKPKFTAVFSCAPTHANQLAAICQKAGLQIPRDLSVISFRSDKPLAINWTGPQTHFETIGLTAVATMLRKSPTPERVLIDPVWNDGATLLPRK